MNPRFERSCLTWALPKASRVSHLRVSKMGRRRTGPEVPVTAEPRPTMRPIPTLDNVPIAEEGLGVHWGSNSSEVGAWVFLNSLTERYTENRAERATME